MLASDRGGDRRCDDRDTGSRADTDADRDGNLAEAEASGRQGDEPAAERQNGDDLAARPLEEVGKLGERRVERGVGTRMGRAGEPEEREYERGDGDDRQLQSPALLECCLHRDRSLAQGAAISPPLRKGASEPRTLKQRMKELGGKPRDFLKRKAKGQGPESAVPLTGTWRPKFGTR